MNVSVLRHGKGTRVVNQLTVGRACGRPSRLKKKKSMEENRLG